MKYISNLERQMTEQFTLVRLPWRWTQQTFPKQYYLYNNTNRFLFQNTESLNIYLFVVSQFIPPWSSVGRLCRVQRGLPTYEHRTRLEVLGVYCRSLFFWMCCRANWQIWPMFLETAVLSPSGPSPPGVSTTCQCLRDYSSSTVRPLRWKH